MTVQFSEVVQSVVDRTKRADKRAEIKAAVNQAVAYFATANFPNDLLEIAAFAIDETESVQSFDISDVANFTRFKRICYIRPSGFNKVLAERTPDKMFHDGRECLDVWYRSGNNIIFKLSRLQSTLKIGYFSYHEKMVEDADEDWILDELTTAVEDFATARIMRSIGEDAEAIRLRQEAMISYEAYKGSVFV